MAKCPKCSSRKGKRQCPGLDAMICSACCGEFRHTEIHCPDDCVYLGQEQVHQQRRVEKSRSQGRHFLKFLAEAVSNEVQWRFSFLFFVEVFAYNRRDGELTDTEILGVLKDLRQLFGKIIIPGQNPHPLSVLFEAQCSEDGELKTRKGFSREDRLNALRLMDKAISRKAGDGTRHISGLLDNFFAPLDLAADVGYVPAAAAHDPRDLAPGGLAPGYRERPSGLILPPTSR